MSSKDIELYSPNQNSTEWEKWLVKTKWSLIEGKPTTFTPTSHNHDDFYLEKNPNIINLSGQDKVHLQENGIPLLSTFNYGLS
jgi:hypothetical protein